MVYSSAKSEVVTGPANGPVVIRGAGDGTMSTAGPGLGPGLGSGGALALGQRSGVLGEGGQCTTACLCAQGPEGQGREHILNVGLQEEWADVLAKPLDLMGDRCFKYYRSF